MIGKDKSVIDIKRCKTKLEVMPKIVKLVGEPVLGTKCEWGKIMFTEAAAVNNCNFDIELTETGCKWTVTSK